MMGPMGTGFAIVMIVYWLFALAVPAACVVGLVWLWVRVLRNRKGNEEACCRACNYSVRGAREFICVECGADLRVVGIKTPTQNKVPGVILFLLLWTFLLPLPACTGAGIMIVAGPKTSAHTSNVSLTPTSGQYLNVDIDNDAYGFMWLEQLFGMSTYMDPVSLSLEDNQNNYGWMQIDPATMTYDTTMHGLSVSASGTAAGGSGSGGSVTVTAGPGSHRAPFDRAAVLAWFDQTSGGDIDITDAAVIAEADELLVIAKQFDTTAPVTFTASQFTVGHTYSSNQDWPAGWWIVVVLVFWVLVYAGGIVLYFVIRARRSRAALPESDPYGPARFAPPA